MRMPELKSLAREHELRNYSRMRKAELVAFSTIWVQIILRCAGAKRHPGSAEGAGEESHASLHWSRKYNLKAHKLTSTPRTKISIKWRALWSMWFSITTDTMKPLARECRYGKYNFRFVPVILLYEHISFMV